MVTAFQPRLANGADTSTQTAFLVIDTESIPDGRLLRLTKYPDENLTDDDAIERAQAEARENSNTGSDFLPVTYQIPVSVCVARVGRDFGLERITCLDAPRYRPREIVCQFWSGLEKLNAKLVTFNGRGFDMPLLELAGYRYGCPALNYFQRSRNRYSGSIDLLDWFSNYGAYRMVGGLNLLAKMLGLPGKMDASGDQVYRMYREGRYQDINDYCMCDTLDTYFIFLRTRVMVGELTPVQEADLIARARDYLTGRVGELPALKQYLENWNAAQPWP